MDLRSSAILTESGHFVNENWAHLSELLQRFDPYLELHWIPTDKRTTDERHPYRIVHNPPPTSRMAPYVVMHCAENDQPQEILARIIAGDNWHNDVQAKLDARIVAERLFQRKKHLDELEASADLAHFLLVRAGNYTTIRDPKTNELIKFDSHRFRMNRR